MASDIVSFGFGNSYLPPGADADGDGMSDLWEDEMFGNLITGDAAVDDDGDEQDNLEEYEADTRPFDPSSRFRATIDAAGLVTVPESSRRRLYTLWFSEDLGSVDPWTELPGAIGVLGNGGCLALGGGPGPGATGFYRATTGQT